MDMKRILQALDTASTKPVEGANDMKRFLQAVSEKPADVITEASNPHKVSLPVQMAMNHYQAPKEQPAPRAPSLLRKYFTEAEEEVIQEEADRKERLRMYSQKIANRVLVKESALKDKEDLQAKRKALQDIQLDPHTHKDPELKAELARRKAALEKEAKNKKLDEIAGAFPSPSTRAKWAADAAASNAAEAKRQELLKAQQLQSNTAEVDRLQKINHHSLDAEIPAKEGVVDTVKSVATKVGDTIANAVPKEFRPFDNETAAKNQQAMKEAPIEMTGDANDPVVHGHQKANPMSLKGRIQQARNQLKELANMAESDDLAVWQQICQLSKGGMFMGLEQNIEQVRHGIAELAAKRKQGGVASRGIDKNISERSVSQAQAHLMAAAAHNPEFAKKVKMKQSVAKEFNKADKGKNIKSLPQRVPKNK